MKFYNITSKIIVAVNTENGHIGTFDSQADFNQIVLRIRNGSKFVNFRVTDLGATVTVELWDGKKKFYDFKLTNETLHAKVFQTLIDHHLN